MKKDFKRTIALLMAVALVATTFTFSAGNTLKASDGEDNAPPVAAETKAPAADKVVKAEQETVEKTQVLQPEKADSDEPKEETEQKEEESDETMPAQSFKKAASNGLTVSVSVPSGALPEGTTMKVSAVSASSALQDAQKVSKEATAAVGVDISFHKDGKEIEPKKAVSVNISGAKLQGDKYAVLHRDDNGHVERVGNASSTGASFKASDFSKYILAAIKIADSEEEATGEDVPEEGDDPDSDNPQEVDEPKASKDANDETPYLLQVTYRFANGGLADNGYAGYYKSDETFSVDVPEKSGYTISASPASYLKDGKITGSIDKDTTVNVVYTPRQVSYKVNHVFEQLDGSTKTETETLQGDIGSETQAVAKTREGYIAEEFDQKNLVNNDDTEVTINYTLNTYKLSYVTDGGSYIEPKYPKHGETVQLTETPTKEGYTFGGWYLDEGFTKAATSVTVTAATKVYAKWNATNVKYTVVVWNQKATDDVNASNAQKTYDYSELKEFTAQVGSTVRAVDKVSSFTVPTGFQLNSSKSDSAVVKADGTTVVNLYLDRKVCTVNYYLYKESYFDWDSWKWVDGGWYVDSSVKGLFGANLKDGEWRTDYTWRLDHSGSTATGTTAILLTSYDFKAAGYGGGNTLNFYGANLSSGRSIYYLNEQANGEFALINTVNLSSEGTLSIHEKYEGYDLFQYREKTSSKGKWGNWKSCPDGTQTSAKYVEIRSTLKSHSFSYYNYNSVAKKQDVKYTASLNSLASYVPTRPAGLKSYYTFDGWYADKALTQKFDFNSTMPNNNLQVYAKWVAPKFEVKFNTGAGATQIDSQKVEGGTVAVCPPDPIKLGYEFAGWYKDEACNTPFDFDQEIGQNTTIYAKWKEKKTIQYTVKYINKETGNELFPAETKTKHIKSDEETITVQAMAKAHESMIPDAISKQLELTWTGSNTITFYYSAPHAVYWKVKYVDAATGAEIHPAAIKSGKVNRVTETSEGIAGYEAVTTQITQDLADETSEAEIKNNIITFQYKPVVLVTVQGKSKTVTYNGQEQKYADFQQIGGIDKYGIKLTLKDSSQAAKGKNAKEGTYNMGLNENSFNVEFTGEKYNNDNTIVRITPPQVDTTLTIQKRNVTLTSATNAWEYDGDAHQETNVEVGGDEFVNGEGATYSGFPSVTDVDEGIVSNEFNYELNDNTLEDNYNITTEYGTIQINDRTAKYHLEFKVKDLTATYDGNEKQITELESYEAKAENGKTYSVSGLSIAGSRTNAGETTVYATGTPVIKNAAGKVVTNQFSVDVKSGTLKINPKDVTLTSGSAEREYNGNPLTNDEVTASGFVGNDGAEYDVTGSQTVVGSSDNTFNYRLNAGTNADNYNITKKAGTLKVTDRQNKYNIAVVANSEIGVYDGSEKSASGLVSNSFDIEGNTYTVSGLSAEAKETNAGTYPVEVSGTATVKDAEGNDVTSQFKISKIDGKLVINKRPVTLTSASAEKEYDGEPLFNHEVKAIGPDGQDAFVGQDGVTTNVTGTITNPGSVSNEFTYNPNNEGMIRNYDITREFGKLTITDPQVIYNIELEPKSEELLYNGQIQSIEGFKTLKFERDGKTYTVEGATASASGISAGKYPVTVNTENVIVRNAAGTDVSRKFNVSSKTGTLTINKRNVTITSRSDAKPYDGEALINHNVDVTGDGFVLGQGARYNYLGSQTAPGRSDNEFNYELNSNTSPDNYVINTVYGTLTVTDYEGTITAKAIGGSCIYDGAAHGATVEVEGLPEVYTVETKSSSATATDVTGEAGIVAKVDTLVIKNAAGEDVTSKLNISKIDGTIVVTPAPLSVTTEGGSKVYDGDPLTVKDATIGGLVNNETAKVVTTGSQTEVGDSDNTYKIEWGTAKASNYKVTSEALGKLVVTENANEIVVTTTGGEFTYDGTEHKATVSVSTLPKGYKVEKAKSNDSATDVTTAPVKANCDELVILNAQGKDVTNKLKITYNDGTIIVKPAPLTVTTHSASKVYDGTALTAEGSITGFVNDETAEFKTTGSQTAVGSSKNAYSIDWNGTAKESNYTVSETLGTLTVNEFAGEITVTTTGGEFTYDGKPHGATVKVTGVPADGYTLIEAASSATATDVTTEAVKATADTLVIKNAAGEDVTTELNITKVDGTIVVNPAPLTVETPSDSKVYNGEALTKAGSINGFVNGETATFETTGTQTEVGYSTNTYSLTFDKTAKKGNYTVSEKLGTLTVTESEDQVVVTTTGGTFEYDGQEHKATVSVSTLPKGYKVEKAKSNDSATDVTTAPVEANCDELVILNAQGKDVTNKLKITYKDGKIVVTPATLTVTTPDASKTYDGTALTAEGSISGFVNGEKAEFKTTGSQTAVGNSKNTYSIDWNGTAKEGNYTVAATVGKLTVNQFAGEITVTTTGSDSPYDGKPHGATVEVKGVPTGYTLDQAASSATATDVTTKPVVATADTLVIKNAAGEDVTTELNIKKVDGTIVVNPVELTVETPSDSKVYDGKALTKAGSIKGFVNEETATFETTGTQTKVGYSTNTYSLTFDKTAKKGNYTVSEKLGTLTVTESEDEIVVTTTGGTFEYDGQEHKATVSVSTLPKGYTLDQAASSATATDVTTEAVKATADTLVIKNAAGEDVTSELNIKKVDGTIVVKPAKLTVTTPNASKTYDGTALTAEGSISGFVEGEKAEFKTTGSQTAVGSSDNTYKIKWETAKESNYTITENLGTLTVNQFAGEITVTTTGGEFTYDGKPHGATVEVTGVPADGYTLVEAASSATATDVTTEAVKATADTLVIKNAAGEDVTTKLNIKKVDGSITIKAKAARVEAKNLSKVYGDDDPELTADVTGTVGDDTLKFTLKRDKGENAGAYVITASGAAEQGNYKVTYSDGTFTINPKEVTLKSGSKGFTYDGNEHSFEEVTAEGFLDGQGVARYYDFPTVKEVKAETTSNEFKYELQENTDSHNYKINTEYGEIWINAAEGVTVTIAGHKESVRYDGQEHTVTGYDVLNINDGDSEGGEVKLLVAGNVGYSEDDFNFKGKAIARGTEAGIYPMNLSSDQFENINPNYDKVTFVVADGQLEIKAVYTLRIHYVDNTGRTLHDDYVGTYLPGESYSINTPRVAGYTPSTRSVVSDVTGMPAEDVEVTVVYRANNPGPGPAPAPGGVVTPNGNDGGYTINQIENPKVPLANNILDEFCCILHLLIMLIALLIAGIYTHDMKKRQRRIFELERELKGDFEE